MLEPILISISLKSKSDDTSYCCRVYHSPRNMPLFLKCSNNEGGKQMRLTYETRQTMNVDLSTIYDTSYLGRVYLGPCQNHIKHIPHLYYMIYTCSIYINFVSSVFIKLTYTGLTL